MIPLHITCQPYVNDLVKNYRKNTLIGSKNMISIIQKYNKILTVKHSSLEVTHSEFYD